MSYRYNSSNPELYLRHNARVRRHKAEYRVRLLKTTAVIIFCITVGMWMGVAVAAHAPAAAVLG